GSSTTVLSPLSLHDALPIWHGRAVLCEKPFTLNAATSRELIDTARAAGVFLMEAMWTRCNPTIRRMVELIADGAIGEVTTVRAEDRKSTRLNSSHVKISYAV